MNKFTDQFIWLDFLKTLAMIAVVLNHVYGFVFNNNILLFHTGFSVTLFILVAGVTSSISISKRNLVDKRYLFNRVSGILIPYLIGSFIAHVYSNRGTFDFIQFLNQIISFSASGPYYFVAFFIQLVLVSTFIFFLFKKYNNIYKHLMIISIIYLISVYFNKHTIIGNIMGGGGKLLGGSYLFVFSLGIFIYNYINILKGFKTNIIVFIVSLVCIVIFEKNQMILKVWSNPPNNYLVFYTIIIFFIVFSSYNIFLSKLRLIIKLIKCINKIGQNSLYIFLYHYIFIHFAINIWSHYININSRVMFSMWVIIWAFLPPLIIGELVRIGIFKKLKHTYFYKS